MLETASLDDYEGLSRVTVVEHSTQNNRETEKCTK